MISEPSFYLGKEVLIIFPQVDYQTFAFRYLPQVMQLIAWYLTLYLGKVVLRTLVAFYIQCALKWLCTWLLNGLQDCTSIKTQILVHKI